MTRTAGVSQRLCQFSSDSSIERPSDCSWIVSRISSPRGPVEPFRRHPQRPGERDARLERHDEQVDHSPAAHRRPARSRPAGAPVDEEVRPDPADHEADESEQQDQPDRRAAEAEQPDHEERQPDREQRPVAEEPTGGDVEEAGRDELALDLDLLQPDDPAGDEVADRGRQVVESPALLAGRLGVRRSAGRRSRTPRFRPGSRCAGRAARRRSRRRGRRQRRRAARRG